MTSEPADSEIDEAVIRQVCKDVSPGAATSLYEGFFSEVMTFAALATRPDETLGERAHAVKSSCATFGLTGLSLLALQIESAVRSGEWTIAAERAARFDRAAAQAIKAARRVLGA